MEEKTCHDPEFDCVNDIFFQIISKLNEDEAHYGGYFDCGKLGIIHVYWDKHQWSFFLIKKSQIIDVNEFLK